MHGVVRYDSQRKRWAIECSPHISLMLKRVFTRISKHPGPVYLSDTPENALNLEWFIQRYPLDVVDKKLLAQRSEQQRKQEKIVTGLISGEWNTEAFDLALPAREYQKLYGSLVLQSDGVLCADEVGLGKAQPLDASVLTPDGWRAIGTLAVGEAIIDPDGGTAIVEAVYPQGEKEIFRVTAKDGATTECCAEHLWMIFTANDRTRNGPGRVLELRSFKDRLVRGRSNGNKTSDCFLPLTAPVEFNECGALPLHPYLLGVLIGDGGMTAGSVTVTKPDRELIDKVASLLPHGVELRPEKPSCLDENITWRLSRQASSGANPLMESLRELNLYGCCSCDKFIPTAYLRSKIEDRIQVLHGLMDSDGDANPAAMIFNTSSPQLRTDFVELVRSLGGIASVGTNKNPKYTYNGETRIGREAYRVNVRLPFNPFSLQRKARLWYRPYMARAIASVKPAGRKEAICIRVSSKRNLYITDGHMVTHNTVSAICAMTDPRTRPVLVVTLTHLPRQWQREINRFAPELRTHIIDSGQPYDFSEPDVWNGEKMIRKNGLFPDVLIINYHKLGKWADRLSGVIKYCIFDEVQELRKPDSQKYAAAKLIADGARFRAALSATPIFNYGDEFHSVMECVRPGAMGTRDEFLREWCGWKGKIEDPRAFGSYVRETGLMIRRTRADVGRELPAFSRAIQYVETDQDALSKIEGSCRELANLILSPNKLGRGERFQAGKEFSNAMRQATGISKAPFCADFVKLLVESGERVVLYAWHRTCYEIFKEKLKEFNPLMYTGSESPQQKERAKDAFISGESPIIMLSLRAGAGLDGLQHVCRTVVFGELDWSPGVMSQCLSADTEILTPQGFKGVDEVNVGDSVCGFDTKTGAMRWVPATDKVDRKLAAGEKMYGTSTVKIDVRVTGGHRMVLRRKTRTTKGVGRSAWFVDTAENLAGEARRFIPTSGMQDAPGVPLSDYELRLIGWALSDGHFDGKCLSIYQQESQPWNADIVEVLNGCRLSWKMFKTTERHNGHAMNIYCIPKGTSPKWSDGEVAVLRAMVAAGLRYSAIGARVNRTPTAVMKKVHKMIRRGVNTVPVQERAERGWLHLEEYFDKDISPLLENVTRHQLKQLIRGLWMGDGVKDPRYGITIITNTNKTMLDRLQSLCIRRGMAATISIGRTPTSWPGCKPCYLIYISDLQEASIPRGKKKNAFRELPSVPGERVWCVTNELGTLVTRRNRRIAVLGNCEGRIHRDGQKDPVLAYYLLSDEGADPVMSEVLGLKRGQIEGLVNPDQELLEQLEIDENHVKRLAEDYLAGLERRAA